MKKLILLTSMLAILSACGSTSGLRNNKTAEMPLDLKKYNYVIVNDFGDGVSESRRDPKIQSEGKRFADIIAKEIKAKDAFGKVGRNVYSTEAALLIDGQITQYEEGDPVLRTIIGMGAGSSHFDAKLYIKDNATKSVLGDIEVDQMSWALGGVIAGTQDVGSHMDVASAKIADEVVSAKKGLTTDNES